MSQKQLQQVKSRLVVVENVYYQSPDQQPVSLENGFSKWLDSDEQPYNRQVKVTAEWQVLDLGWVKDCGMLVISNPLERRQVNPTSEQRAEELGRVLEVGIDSRVRHIDVCPGESSRFQPTCTTNVYIRCSVPTKITITAFPK